MKSKQNDQEEIVRDLVKQVFLMKSVINKLNTRIIQLQSKVESLEAKVK